MIDDKDFPVVFRTPQHSEAGAIGDLFEEAGLPCEVRIVVRPEDETKAIALIEAHMKAIGAAPTEEKPEAEAGEDELLPCPNCEVPGIHLHQPCGGCGFEILKADGPPAIVTEHAPGALTFCPECRDPLTFASGACLRCNEALEPLESADRLCPNLTHVLYRDTVGGFVCKACRRVWVEPA